MKIYEVGGCVRDSLMGRTPDDIDYVVESSSHEQMIAAGFKQVGADFPVYLKDGNEYALTRTERKSGNGHNDFTCNSQGVSLIEDLKRRDLSVNSVARDITTGDYIDPFNGREDIKNKILRHVDDDGFMEDPLRILRLARFCAKFPEFSVAPETVKFCKLMVLNGDLLHLTPERVWMETEKALNARRPSRYFIFLNMIGALEQVFPELFALVGVPAGPYKHHPEGDAFVHTMMVLDQATDSDLSEVMRFAALVHDLGKGRTPKNILPHHYGHEEGGIEPLNEMCDRLKIPNEYRDTAKVVCRYHTHVHNTFKLNPKTLVKVFQNIYINDERKFRDLVDRLVFVSRSDARGRGSFYANQPYPQAARFFNAMMDMHAIKARDVCTEEELKNVNVVKSRLYKARLEAVKAALSR